MPRKRKLPEGLKERGGVYYSDIYAQGRLVRKRLSTQLDVAEQLLHELQARADRADFDLLDNDYSLADLRTEFVRHCKQVHNPKTVARYETCLHNALGKLPATRVRQLTPQVILTYREERLEE
jgi:hypothetical protein